MNRWELPVADGSHNEPRRWRVDGGEGMGLCLRGAYGGRRGPSQGRCRHNRARQPHEKARKLGQEEAGQHKHVAQIRLRVGDWQAWYSISMIQIVGVPVHHERHRKQWVCGLRSGLPEASTCQ